MLGFSLRALVLFFWCGVCFLTAWKGAFTVKDICVSD